jgi:hypothetical protein
MRVYQLSEQSGVNWLKTSPRHSQALLTEHLLFASRICYLQPPQDLGDDAYSGGSQPFGTRDTLELQQKVNVKRSRYAP